MYHANAALTPRHRPKVARLYRGAKCTSVQVALHKCGHMLKHILKRMSCHTASTVGAQMYPHAADI